MVNFIKPKIQQVETDSYLGLHKNYPVNIELCTSLIKYNMYARSGTEYPAIEFKGCGAKWLYDIGDTSTRDAQYKEILSINKFAVKVASDKDLCQSCYGQNVLYSYCCDSVLFEGKCAECNNYCATHLCLDCKVPQKPESE